jgi:alpha-ketoglutarate-dependent taurine dioxygenase
MARSFGTGSFDFRQAGFGGLAYKANENLMNMPMTYEQRWITSRYLYSCCIAKLEEDTKYKNDPALAEMFRVTKELIDQANRDYKSYFEDKSTDDKENAFKELLAQIFDGLTAIQAKTKMIEKEYIDEAPVA